MVVVVDSDILSVVGATNSVGLLLGESEGIIVGLLLGETEGSIVGFELGNVVGCDVGDTVGAAELL